MNIHEIFGRGLVWGLLIGAGVLFIKSTVVPVHPGIGAADVESGLNTDFILVENLKAECEEVHQTECEISVFYLPKASDANDGR
jgi:hypothetical protein